MVKLQDDMKENGGLRFGGWPSGELERAKGEMDVASPWWL